MQPPYNNSCLDKQHKLLACMPYTANTYVMCYINAFGNLFSYLYSMLNKKEVWHCDQTLAHFLQLAIESTYFSYFPIEIFL